VPGINNSAHNVPGINNSAHNVPAWYHHHGAQFK
jgi:hypothetical protein